MAEHSFPMVPEISESGTSRCFYILNLIGFATGISNKCLYFLESLRDLAVEPILHRQLAHSSSPPMTIVFPDVTIVFPDVTIVFPGVTIVFPDVTRVFRVKLQVLLKNNRLRHVHGANAGEAHLLSLGRLLGTGRGHFGAERLQQGA